MPASGPGPLRLVFLGLSITSSWGNGHATNYRALLRSLAQRGHDVLFLERDVPWYAANRDLPQPEFGRTVLYGSLDELKARHGAAVREADAVVLGSYVPDGVAVGEWVVATARGARVFYDIDTPITLAMLQRARERGRIGGTALESSASVTALESGATVTALESSATQGGGTQSGGANGYLAPHLVPQFDCYLSFTGGPVLDVLRREYGCRRAVEFYCMVDPAQYWPREAAAADDGAAAGDDGAAAAAPTIDLGYIGTYSPDRQPALERLLLAPARTWRRGRFVVAGPQYPPQIEWPRNVERIEHCPPAAHRDFYTSQRFTLNITRQEMIRAGYSPSVRLFEAAACATPIISDRWPGLETIFEPGEEILIADTADDVLGLLRDLPESRRRAIGEQARRRVLQEHTAEHRARELEKHLAEIAR